MTPLLLLLLTSAHATWKVETRPNKLLVELPKPPRKPGQTITARDLDDHFAYPCVDDDEIETRAQPPEADTVLPRILWTDEHRNEFWICASERDLERLDDHHVYTDQTFVLATKDKRKRFRLMLNEGPLIDRPIEVFAEKGGLRVVSFFPFADDSLTPFTETRIKCAATGCVVAGETCVLDTKGVDAAAEVKRFDAAFAKRQPKDDPPTEWDRLFLAAAGGDKAAASRFRHFPVPLSEGQTAADQIARYQSELDDAERLGCGGKRR